jgi:hypothetical protein
MTTNSNSLSPSPMTETVSRGSPASQPFSASALVPALRVHVVRVMAEERRRETNDNDEQHQDQDSPLADPDETLVHTPKGNPLSVRPAPQRSPNTAQNWRSERAGTGGGRPRLRDVVRRRRRRSRVGVLRSWYRSPTDCSTSYSGRRSGTVSEELLPRMANRHRALSARTTGSVPPRGLRGPRPAPTC